MRRMLGGDWFWWLSIGLSGEVGALVILLRLMGWGFGSLFVWGGKVGRVLSKTLFLVYLALPDLRRHLLRIMWSVPTVSSSGTLSFTHLIHDWEVEVLASFYSCLYSFKFEGHLEDVLSGSLEKRFL
jgi:hypothetical protein